MSAAITIVIIEDAAPIATQYRFFLKYLHANIEIAATGEDAKQLIERLRPEIILLDLKLPDMQGQDILKWLKQQPFESIVIVTTGHGSVDIAVDLMRLGADDFLEKPVSAERLRTTINTHLDKVLLKKQLKQLTESGHRDHFHGFIGKSLAMQTVYRIIECAANSQATIFITGESGTGKEVCAEAIHQQSQRKHHAFVALNCAAIPKDLMESEIFGHIKGSFTGAISDRKGAALLADGGTLFLDEICEMDVELQKKLLRFLQTGRFQRVGSSQELQVDVRILCATNRDPLVEVQAGRFREDLYYRLHVVPIHLPPLRERGHDIIDIATHLLRQYSQEDGKHFTQFASDVMQIFKRYQWPGNVRQLQNVIRNIVVLNQGDTVLTDHLPAPLNALLAQPLPVNSSAINQEPLSANTSVSAARERPKAHPILELHQIRPLAEIEKDVIEQAISLCDGNIQKAANLLEVSPSTIYRKKQSWDDMANSCGNESAN
ncbi:MAG: sigma-54-dependent transcriptional regulator [Shewanella sp.]